MSIDTMPNRMSSFGGFFPRSHAHREMIWYNMSVRVRDSSHLPKWPLSLPSLSVVLALPYRNSCRQRELYGRDVSELE